MKYETLEVNEIEFGWEELLPKQRKRPLSDEHTICAKRVWEEGSALYKGRAYIAEYSVVDFVSDSSVKLSDADGNYEILHIGEKAGYLHPAKKAIVAICTVGSDIEKQMRMYGNEKEIILEHYMDVFGVRALNGVRSKLREFVEERAKKLNWGVGPSMQPGSMLGWSVEGQRDLLRLAGGDRTGIRINESSLLIPLLSNSCIIGMGEHYSSKHVGSLCHECPRYSTCLWRKEPIADE